MAIEKYITRNSQEFGGQLRALRKQLGLKIEQAAANGDFGKRFLSELERGKETAQLGKAFAVLQEMGLGLAIVPLDEAKEIHLSHKHHRPNSNQEFGKIKEFSTSAWRSKLDFPYDWSNSKMSDEAVAAKILNAGRFKDIVTAVKALGLQAVEGILASNPDLQNNRRVTEQLERVREGARRAGAAL